MNLPPKSRRLGYALWPELILASAPRPLKSRRLGYALWPERKRAPAKREPESRRLGYALWPAAAGGGDWGGVGLRSLLAGSSLW